MKNSPDMLVCCKTNGPWLQGLGAVTVWAHRAESDTIRLSLRTTDGPWVFLSQQQPNLHYEYNLRKINLKKVFFLSVFMYCLGRLVAATDGCLTSALFLNWASCFFHERASIHPLSNHRLSSETRCRCQNVIVYFNQGGCVTKQKENSSISTTLIAQHKTKHTHYCKGPVRRI